MSDPQIAASAVHHRPLKVGLFLPFTERMMDGATPRWADLLALARRAEEVGLDSLWLGDHLLVRGDETIGAWEGWSLLAALAAATRRVTLGPLVACTGFRSPALLAKMADTLDEISGGRLVLGLGAGYIESEYRAFGYPYDQRVSRFAEALTIITTLLRAGRIDFVGRYYQARECELRPRGPRPTGPPILVGALGSGERMLRLTAEHVDAWNGWLVHGRNRPAAVPALRASVDAACRAVGREPATLERTVTIAVNPTGGDESAHTFPRGIVPLTGAPGVLAATLRSFAREGIAHIQLVLRPCTLASIEALAPVLDDLDRGSGAVAASARPIS